MSGIPVLSPTLEKSIDIGTRVEILEKGLQGIVEFYGPTAFSQGTWVGVVLDEPKGKNNGTVQGKVYFNCDDNFGIFVRPGQVKILNGDNESVSSQDSSSTAGKPTAPVSGLKAPSQLKKSSVTKGDAESSKMRAPNKMASSKGSRISPSPSTEKLKQTPSAERLKTSTEKLKQSPSSERLKQSPSSERLKNEKIKVGETPEPSKSHQASKMGAPSSVRKESVSKGGKVVAEKVAQLKEDIGRRDSSEGIVRVVPATMTEGAELEYLRSEVKDVTEKLETLRAKRQEDKQKLIDYERCKIQLQGLLEYKNKMTEVQAEIQRQLQQAKKEAKEAIEAREVHSDEMSGLAEAVEMATLDKEMAEEKAELLQQELETLKERCQELEMDLEILRSEIQDEETKDGVSIGIKVKQLEQQNERLKEALVKMRDLSTQHSQDNQRLAKENEALKTQVSDVNKRNDKFTMEAQQYDNLITELKEQVDAALGSEDMVEQLTSKNLTLEERVRELEETVEDLEQMRQMDEEMQESARDIERDLRQELDLSGGRINELKLQLQQSADHIADYELTVKKFRQRVADLQEQIQDLKDQLLTAEAKTRRTDDSDDNDNILSTAESLYLGKYAAKSFAEAVENEIRKLELENALQHVKYLKSFLPDNFGKAGGDNDAVLLNLLFPRFSAKCEAFMKQLIEKFPMVPGGMRREHVAKSHKGEQWGFSAKFTYYLCTLCSVLHRFESVLHRCSVERLARLAQLYPEMAAQERLFDDYTELLKTNRLDENTSFENLERVINYFQNLYTVHLVSEEYDGTKFMVDSVKQLLAGTHWFRTELMRLKFYILEGHESTSLYKLLGELELFIGDGEQFCVRIRKRLPSGENKILKLSDETCERLSEATVNLVKAADILHLTCRAASTQVSMLPDVEGLDSSRLRELMNEACVKVFGKSNEKPADEVLKCVARPLYRPYYSLVLTRNRK